ncbi:hypothetical protein GCM10009609_33620 [Pseudonocardia aurantiaca]|uniref:Luciferase-like domain-containing protein n=1 Tax=Pseudonocardia aurantiaca TaxID=75290 RepID=A0ABW4FR19_9PSEU
MIVGTVEALDPTADPDGAEQAVEALAAAGATTVVPRLRSESVEHHLDQLRAMAALPCFAPARAG